MKNKKRDSFFGLLPLTVLLVAYMGTGLGTGSFDSISLMTGIAIAPGVVLLLNKRDEKTPFEGKITLYCKGGGKEILILMVLIFLLVGALGGVAKGIGTADSIVDMGPTILPGNLTLPGIFPIGCLLSLSMEALTGTVTALMSITVDISNKTDINVRLLAGAVASGVMFGNNLSFIPDTAITITRAQEISIRDKFKADILMILPAVVINVTLLAIQSRGDVSLGNIGSFSFVSTISYILVIALSLVGLNIVVAMIVDILSGIVIGCFNGGFTLAQSLTVIRDGAIGMENMASTAVMVDGMVKLTRHLGGVDFLINQLTKGAKSSKGGKLSIAALISLLDIATTNNTMSVITAGSIARDIVDDFHISGSHVASILDLFSPAFNSPLPYAGQLPVAGGLASVSPTTVMGYNWYSILMIVLGIVFIIVGFPKFKGIRIKKEQVEKET